MPDNDTPYSLKGLNPELLETLERAICQQVTDAVAGAESRNSDLQTWRDQLEGNGVTSANTTWDNACNLTSPMSMKAFLTVLAQIVGATKRDPPVAVEAFSAEDEDNATVLESWLSMEKSRSSLDKHTYDLAHEACWGPGTVGYVGWLQATRTVREVGYSKPGHGLIIGEEERQDGVKYDTVPMAEEVTDERYDIRTISFSDFFLYPPTSRTIDRATMVCERMSVTEGELYDGIGDYGYDEEAVDRLCVMGPSNPSEMDLIVAEQQGLEEDTGKDGFYRIYICYTRLPRNLPGDKQVPEHLLQDDFLVVCCPESNVVLKMAFSPFKERPYFTGGIMPKPDSIQGYSLMELLEGLQSEANAEIQFGVDSMNVVNNPVLIGPENERDNVMKAKLQPGAYVGLNNPGEVKPLEWNRSPLRDMVGYVQWLDNQAQGLVSAEGQGQLAAKVRKQGEIDNLQAQTSAKFGLYLSNFQRTVVAELYRRLIALKLQFGDVDDEGEDFLDSEGHSRKLTAAALRGKYNIVASGTSLTHSPEGIIEVNKQASAIQTEYLMAKGKLPPDDLKLIWHGRREMLHALGIRTPEAWIGDEPQGGPPPEQPAPPQGPVQGNGTGQPQLSPGISQQLGANN